MPVIPEMRRQTATPGQRVSTIQTPGYDEVGRAVTGAVQGVLNARDNYQLQKARSDFAIMNQDHSASFKGDRKYKDMGDRWQAGMDEKFNAIAENISDPTVRNTFLNESRPRISAGRIRINDYAFEIESDVEMGDISTRLNGLMTVALEGGTDDDVSVASKNASGMIDGAVELGYMSAEKGQHMKAAYKNKMASVMLTTMDDPRKAREMLEGPVGDNLLAENKLKIRQQLQTNVIQQDAQDKVDSLGEDFSLADVQVVGRAIDDVDEREAFERKAKVQYADNQNAIHAEEKDFFDNEYYTALTDPEHKLDMKTKEFENLSPQQQTSLLKMDLAKKAPPKNTKYSLEDDMRDLLKNEDFNGARKLFERGIAGNQFSRKDQTYYGDLLRNNDPTDPDNYESTFTDMQNIESALAVQGVTSTEDKAVLRDKLSGWIRRETDAGRKPNDADIEDRIKYEAQQLELDPNAWFESGREKKVYSTMSEDDREILRRETLNNPTEVSDAQFNVVMDEMFNQPVNDEQKSTSIDLALQNPERLNGDNQLKTLNHLQEIDPVGSQRVIDAAFESLIGVENPKPYTPAELLEAYERARTAQ